MAFRLNTMFDSAHETVPLPYFKTVTLAVLSGDFKGVTVVPTFRIDSIANVAVRVQNVDAVVLHDRPSTAPAPGDAARSATTPKVFFRGSVGFRT